MKVLARLIRPLLDVAVPPLCCGCERLLERRDEGICPACRNLLRPVRAGDPAYEATRARVRDGGGAEDLVCLYYMEEEGPLRTIIHRLKYGHMRALGVLLGEDLGGVLRLGPDESEDAWVIPVPLHGVRERERGYNQSEAIAEGIGRVTGIPLLPRALRRVRPTPSQTGLSAGGRAENVRGAFGPGRDASLVRGRALVLADDVVTSGATLSSCSSLLGHLGAARVVACSVALAP
ncbi:MAG: ComF family protein [Bacteroidota bacterium]